jgi:hypothetical protein
MQGLAVIVALALAACGDSPSSEEQANGQAAPPIEPQPILYPDIEANNLYGTSCAFVARGGGLGAVMLAMMDDAYIKLGGKLVRLSADSGSIELPYGTRARYAGTNYSLELDVAEGEGVRSGAESITYPGKLTIRNSAGQVAYDKAGEVQCGS